MFSKTLVLALSFAYVQARFGQEQIPIPAIAAVKGGDPGRAATIAGGAISTLLGAANPCLKLQTADTIIEDLGTGADSIAAAIGLVRAEQNFNNFTSDRPVFCNDPTLPKTQILRGILPLVDPAVTDAAKANALSAQSEKTPFDADGLSVAEILAKQGFTTFTTKNLAGAVGPTGAELAGGATGGGGGGNNADNGGNNADNGGGQDNADPTQTQDDNAPAETEAPSQTQAPADCPPDVTVTVTVTGEAPDATDGSDAGNQDDEEPPADNEPPVEEPPANNQNPGVPKSTIAGLDFGKCTPAMKFVGGLGGRPKTEFTFQAIDPLISSVQQEALNPAIIVNRICDDLTNTCGANQAAKDKCREAQAAVDSTQRNAATAVKFNTALGFANIDVNRRALDDAQRKRFVEGVKRRSARV